MPRNFLDVEWRKQSSVHFGGGYPNCPCIMTDGLPALEGSTSSEALALHLNVLHAVHAEHHRNRSK